MFGKTRAWPWTKWPEADFLANPFTARMHPPVRAHLRSLIIATTDLPAPWVKNDDRELSLLADCADVPSWLLIRETDT